MKSFFNPKIHHRCSIRLLNYNYSRPGGYLITIFIHDRWQRLFGDVVDGKMVLNQYVAIVKSGVKPKLYGVSGVRLDY